MLCQQVKPMPRFDSRQPALIGARTERSSQCHFDAWLNPATDARMRIWDPAARKQKGGLERPPLSCAFDSAKVNFELTS